MKRLAVLTIVFVFLFCCLVALAETKKTEINECKEVYNQCKQIKDQKTSKKISYIMCSETDGKWQINDKGIETKEDWESQVDLYISNKKVRLISYSSYGEDGGSYIEYYFRENETTAYYEEDERIASGFAVKILTKIYLNSRGTIISKKMRKYDCFSDKEIKGDIEGLTLEYPTVFNNVNEFIKYYEIPYKNI
jgi:hypothetical protein